MVQASGLKHYSTRRELNMTRAKHIGCRLAGIAFQTQRRFQSSVLANRETMLVDLRELIMTASA
jgi:hypothetical protein